MEKIHEILGVASGSPTAAWVEFGLVAVVAASFLLFVQRMLFSQLTKLAQKSSSDVDDILIDNIRKPTTCLAIYLGLYISLRFTDIPVDDMQVINTGVKTGFIVFLIWILERFLDGGIRGNLLLSNSAPSTKSMISVILRVLVWVIGALMILDSVGISIAPLLASLGVGSLAVALALQDTLSNFFSGLYLLADKPFRIGDRVEIEGGVHGYVIKVGWRSTHILTIANNIMVVPNAKVASATLTNYDLKEQITNVVVPVGVSYDCDLEKVEKVCFEVATQVQKDLEQGIDSYEPLVRFKEFADSSINLIVIMQAKSYGDTFYIHHYFVKELHKRFAKENIEIPFPQRVLHMQNTPTT